AGGRERAVDRALGLRPSPARPGPDRDRAPPPGGCPSAGGPRRGGGGAVGVVGIRAPDPRRFQDPVRRQLLETFSGQVAASLERVRLARASQRAKLQTAAEGLRPALLSSLSHDLRTPLAGIEGAASSLLQDGGPQTPNARRERAQTIVEESRRMTRLVANLLEMVRLESGALQVQKEWQPLEEGVGG